MEHIDLSGYRSLVAVRNRKRREEFVEALRQCGTYPQQTHLPGGLSTSTEHRYVYKKMLEEIARAQSLLKTPIMLVLCDDIHAGRIRRQFTKKPKRERPIVIPILSQTTPGSALRNIQEELQRHTD